MQLLNRHQVAERTGLSVSSIKRLEAQGRFPRRVPISENRVGWLVSEIDEWIAARVAERDELGGAVAEPERAGESAPATTPTPTAAPTGRCVIEHARDLARVAGTR